MVWVRPRRPGAQEPRIHRILNYYGLFRTGFLSTNRRQCSGSLLWDLGSYFSNTCRMTPLIFSLLNFTCHRCNVNKFYILSTQYICVFSMVLTINTIFLNGIIWLVFISTMDSVLCEVQTEYLYLIRGPFKKYPACYYFSDMNGHRDAEPRKRPANWSSGNWQIHQRPRLSLLTFLSQHEIPQVQQPPYSSELAQCDFIMSQNKTRSEREKSSRCENDKTKYDVANYVDIKTEFQNVS